jgi:predicted PurR-regulated permease PerM
LPKVKYFIALLGYLWHNKTVKNITRAFHSGRAVFFLMVFICCILAGAVLKIASSVILPFTIAVLLAFVMYPMLKGLDKLHCPRFLSILLAVIIIITGLYIFGVVLFMSGRMIVAQYPKYESRFAEIYAWVARVFELPYDKDLSFWESLWVQPGIRTWIREFTFSFSNIFLRFLSNAVFVVLFLVFLLLEASFFKEKLETAFESRIDRISRMGNDIIHQITRYLAAKFLISLVNGIVFALAFYIVGLEFAIVWGIVQFVMNFIPTLGSIVSGAAMSIFALLQFWPNPGPVILVVAIILGVNMILGNILDPKIIGDHVGISPLLVLISLAIWGWLWGFAGMVMAVPITVIIKIVCKNIPIMEPISVLIGSRRSVQAKKAENEKTET